MTAPGHHPGSPCRHRDRGAVSPYGHDVKHGTAAADHLPASCDTTARVRGFVVAPYRLSIRTGTPLCNQRGTPTPAEASIRRAAPVHVPVAVYAPRGAFYSTVHGSALFCRPVGTWGKS